MANCCVPEDVQQQRIVNEEIDRRLRRDLRYTRREIKFLLLGKAGSGKSTFLKQMKIIYGDGYSLEERKGYTKLVFQNVVEAMQVLCKAMGLLQIEYSNAAANNKNVNIILQTSTEDVRGLEAPLTRPVQELWADSGIQKAWNRRREFSLPNSAKYFFEDIQRISASDFIPNDQDILHLNVPSSSVHEYLFDVDTIIYRMVDISGSIMNKTKVMSHFESDSAVECLFFVALDEYDQMIRENFGTEYEEVNALFQSRSTFPWYQLGGHNGLEESKTMFRTLLNPECFPWVKNVSLLLNKYDLLEELEEENLSPDLGHCFPEFTGLATEDNAAGEFILSQFLNLNPNVGYSVIPNFNICATDTQHVQFVFSNVIDNRRRSSPSWTEYGLVE